MREDANSRTYIVAVPEVPTAMAVAAALVDGEGVRLLELYGGFGPAGGARVIEAIDAKAPVGIPSYGYSAAADR